MSHIQLGLDHVKPTILCTLLSRVDIIRARSQGYKESRDRDKWNAPSPTFTPCCTHVHCPPLQQRWSPGPPEPPNASYSRVKRIRSAATAAVATPVAMVGILVLVLNPVVD